MWLHNACGKNNNKMELVSSIYAQGFRTGANTLIIRAKVGMNVEIRCWYAQLAINKCAATTTSYCATSFCQHYNENDVNERL